MNTARVAFIFTICWTALLAAPAPQKDVKEIVPILKQINQMNDDGTYTFGYENGDGTFRVETKDLNGYIRGKYGYFDEDGVLKTLDYEAGKKTVKLADSIPNGVSSPLPANRKFASTPEQRALDLEYFSVDLDEDGMPDNFIPDRKPQVPLVPQQAPLAQQQARAAASSPAKTGSSFQSSLDEILRQSGQQSPPSEQQQQARSSSSSAKGGVANQVQFSQEDLLKLLNQMNSQNSGGRFN